MLQTLLSGVAGKALGGGGSAGVLPEVQQAQPNVPIHVAPVGVNLGEILAPFNQGSPENGGFSGAEFSRYVPARAMRQDTMPARSFDLDGDFPKLALIGIALGAGAYFLLFKNGGL